MAKNGFSISNRLAFDAEGISANKTLTVDDCGKRFEIINDSFTVTLPDPAEAGDGWNVRIYNGGANNYTISGSAAGNLFVVGMGAEDGASYPATLATPADTAPNGSSAISFAVPGNQKQGDQVYITCGHYDGADASAYYVRLQTAQANAATLIS